VNPKLPTGSTCEQCQKVAQELQDAWTSDLQELRTRLEDVALSSGRDPLKLAIHWIFSMAEMPDVEMKALLQSHYPRVAEAQRNKQQHETTTGHSVILHGRWWLHPYAYGWRHPYGYGFADSK
jgi:hypothetical protein